MIFFSKFIKINYDYEICQSKENDIPLLFLHGWGGSVKSFGYFFEKLKKNKTCINIDFPPFGLSEFPIKPLTVKDYAEIVIDLLNNLKINKVDIVAHSFGGRIAIYLASRTKFVNKMLLTSSAGFVKKKNKLKVMQYKILKTFCKIRLCNRNVLDKFVSKDYKNLNGPMKKTFSNVVKFDERRYLRNIDIPVLLVWGTFDKETPFYFTKIFKKHIKDCEVIEFKDCSHFAYLERPNLFLKILFSYFIKKES